GAEPADRETGDGFQVLASRYHLVDQLPPTQLRERPVRPRVEGDGVAPPTDLSDEVGMALGLAREHEERRFDPELVEHVEHGRGDVGMGAVVVGEMHDRLLGADLVDGAEDGVYRPIQPKGLRETGHRPGHAPQPLRPLSLRLAWDATRLRPFEPRTRR